jgi:hypothetical protein
MALYDSENNRLLDTNDNVLHARATFTVGTREVKKIYVGENEVKAIYIGDNLVYEKEPEIVVPQLDAPVISLDNDNLVIEEVENAEYYDIYVDGVLEETIDNRPGFEVTIACTNRNITRIFCCDNSDGTDGYDLLLDNGDSQTVTVNVPQDKPYLNIETSGGPHSLNSISNATWVTGWKLWDNQDPNPSSIGGAVVEITGDNATVNMTGVSF